MKRHLNAWLLLLALLAMLGATLFALPRPQPEQLLASVQSDGADGLVTQDGGVMIDINRADEALLMTLPGIGPSLASAIAEYRAKSGGFQDIEQLTQVPGIGPAKFAAIRDRITCIRPE